MSQGWNERVAVALEEIAAVLKGAVSSDGTKLRTLSPSEAVTTTTTAEATTTTAGD
jgi:hypothetical protein